MTLLLYIGSDFAITDVKRALRAPFLFIPGPLTSIVALGAEGSQGNQLF
jgi:hypothetical protein